jgi:ankyrin repeat protein
MLCSAHLFGLVLPHMCRMLLWAGAQLNVSGVKSAALLCSAVYEGDMQLLRRLLRAGARADAEDYDKRTALHIAASDGNMPAVRSTAGQAGTQLATL